MNKIDSQGTHKVCNRCRTTLPLAEFHRSRTAPDGRQYKCKPCSTLTRREWDVANPERLLAYNRTADLRRYGLTPDSFAEMLAAQGGRCASCSDPLVTGKVHVDHDHACCPARRKATRMCGNCVRGLLCPGCNTGLGMFKDSPARLRAAAEYLERSRNG